MFSSPSEYRPHTFTVYFKVSIIITRSSYYLFIYKNNGTNHKFISLLAHVGVFSPVSFKVILVKKKLNKLN